MTELSDNDGLRTLVLRTPDEAWEHVRKHQHLFMFPWTREKVQEFYDRGDAIFAEWTWRPATQADLDNDSQPILNRPGTSYQPT